VREEHDTERDGATRQQRECSGKQLHDFILHVRNGRVPGSKRDTT
jgi:hypothetical protein